jgi:hypothetical protein
MESVHKCEGPIRDKADEGTKATTHKAVGEDHQRDAAGDIKGETHAVVCEAPLQLSKATLLI